MACGHMTWATCPHRPHDGEAVSKTVEYAFDDWTIAQMARSMGDKM